MTKTQSGRTPPRDGERADAGPVDLRLFANEALAPQIDLAPGYRSHLRDVPTQDRYSTRVAAHSNHVE